MSLLILHVTHTWPLDLQYCHLLWMWATIISFNQRRRVHSWGVSIQLVPQTKKEAHCCAGICRKKRDFWVYGWVCVPCRWKYIWFVGVRSDWGHLSWLFLSELLLWGQWRRNKSAGLTGTGLNPLWVAFCWFTDARTCTYTHTHKNKQTQYP